MGCGVGGEYDEQLLGDTARKKRESFQYSGHPAAASECARDLKSSGKDTNVTVPPVFPARTVDLYVCMEYGHRYMRT